MERVFGVRDFPAIDFRKTLAKVFSFGVASLPENFGKPTDFTKKRTEITIAMSGVISATHYNPKEEPKKLFSNVLSQPKESTFTTTKVTH